MEQYDVYSSRNGLSGATVSIPRSHGKYKRDKGDFGNDELKMITLKVPRQSSPQSDAHLVHQSESNAMSVLPRLLRTMTNGTGRENTGIANTAASGHISLTDSRGSGGDVATSGCIEGDNHSSIVSRHAVGETDSSSSSSSFISTPSSGSNSSFISFIAPGQLSSMAAMAAAAALNSPGTTAPVTAVSRDTPESAGLVTLATASTMLEKEWLVRTAFATDNTTSTTNSISNDSNEDGTSTTATQQTTHLPQTTSELVTLTMDHGVDSNPGSSPPMLFRTLASTSPHSQLNGSTPVTRAVLNVQGLAALIRETQKQRSASNPSLELQQNSVLPVTSDTDVPPCSNDTRIESPSHLGTSSTPTLLTLAPITQSSANTTAVTDQSTENPVLPAANTADSGSTQPTAFISLQPAPGSLLSSSDLQQLMASGEFMNSARTLLGQSPDGSTRQLYLLVPSDYPVIMPRNSTNQTGSNMAPSSPLTDSNPSTAPILEAISPGVEPEENCNPLPNLLSSVRSPQPVTMALPQLAGAVLAPMSSTSTALSTLIAGLDARNQAQHARYSSTQTAIAPASAASTSPSSWSNTNSIVHTTDSSRIRLPINLPGLSLSDHNIISTDQSSYSNVASNRISTLLGSVKSDPDMYTPNGHPYPSIVEDVNRFRSYPTYSQSASTHELPGSGGRTSLASSSANNATFFQSDLSTSILLPQSTLLKTTSMLGGVASVVNAAASTGNNNGSTGGNNLSGVVGGTTSGNPSNTDQGIGNHFLPSPSLSRVNPTFNPNSLSVSTSGPGSKMVDECRRNITGNLLSNGANGRNDQTSTAYLEHLNPESKDIRRRVSHNEVERRRRDRINTWISELYKLLPPDEQAKSQYQSKGIVLKRVCEYFQNVDSMLKAANAAVEQTRVENGLLRQRNRELQQENQLLSASLHLGAAAAAAHLKNRQPRAPLHTNPEDANGAGPGDNGSAQLKEPNETAEYPATVTVFAVNPNTDYGHGSSFSQVSSVGLLPTQSVPSASFATVATLNNGNSGVFTLHSSSTSAGSLNTSLVNNTVVRPLTLPSLDLVANHSDSRPE